jgi:hypothetical protein
MQAQVRQTQAHLKQECLSQQQTKLKHKPSLLILA